MHSSSGIRLVDDTKGLAAVADALAGAERVFIDTEFESGRDGTRLSLVQLATASDACVVDVLRLGDLERLRPALARATWVVHAGGQDVPLLMRALGLAHPPELFDTQTAFALLGPEHSVSLQYLVYRAIGRRMTKSHQLDDWTQRPLSESMLAYALDDVLVLRDAYPALERQLTASGKLAFVGPASHETIFVRKPPAPPLTIADFRNAWLLDPIGQRALLALLAWHEALDPDDRIDGQPQKVLLAIASRAPRSQAELARIKGLSPRIVARHARPILACVAEAVENGGEVGFMPLEPSPYATWQSLDAESWLARTRYEVCRELDIALELALPSRLVARIADAIAEGKSRAEAAELLEGWRRDAVLPALLRRARADVA